ncbi:MAG: amino acid adenylation domain-containing protein [Vicinamibacterales bacterium]
MALPTEQSLVDYLESSASRFPERQAVVDPKGWSLTYQDLNRQADSVAGFLHAVGVRPGDRVGVIAPKGARAVVAFLGIMKARAAYVPADYTAPTTRNRTILADCEAKVVFLSTKGVDLLEGWSDTPPAAVVFLDDAPPASGPSAVSTYQWTDAVAHSPARVADRSRTDLAYILYTSGSTGIPKGVMLSHENALSFVDWCSGVFAPSEHDRFSSHAPFHFDLSVLDLYLSLKHGSTLFIISEDVGKSPKDLAQFIAVNRLTVWYSTPSILTLLAEFGSLGSRDYGSLRLVLFAGEVFPPKHLRRLVDLWPAPTYYNLYGPTETNVVTFSRIPTPVPADRVTSYPIGEPCSHCQACVMDSQGSEVPIGTEGLLYISGPSVFSGYWNRREHDVDLFREHLGRRWYNTGDVVRHVAGEGFVYIGRRDRMVKRRGYRVELGEIERGLYEHSGVAEAAVVAIPDEAAGVRVFACLSTAGAERPSIIDLKTFCASHLPSYMSPDVFLFFDHLPRTSTDKVDYQALTRAARVGQGTRD